MAWVLLQLENEGQDKRVESVWFPCADEGSIPSTSTFFCRSRKMNKYCFFICLFITTTIIGCQDDSDISLPESVAGSIVDAEFAIKDAIDKGKVVKSVLPCASGGDGWTIRFTDNTSIHFPINYQKDYTAYITVGSDSCWYISDDLGCTYQYLRDDKGDSINAIVGISSAEQILCNNHKSDSGIMIDAIVENNYSHILSLSFSNGKIFTLPKSENVLTGFSFKVEDNKGIGTSDLVYTIGMNRISVITPYMIDKSVLVASFNTPVNNKVFVGETEQTSGVNVNDFTYPVTYKVVSPDGLVNNYKIDIHNTGLPIISINTPDGAEIGSNTEWTDGASIIIQNADGTIDYQDDKLQIRGRGNNTWSYPKKPYALKLNKKSEILGMPKHKRWVLLANWMDRTLLRNEFAFEIARNTGLAWTPRGKFVEVILNGKHIGNYYLCEQIKVDENRVNIVDMKKTDISGGDVTGGYLVELDTYYDEVNKFKSKYKRLPYMFKEPDEDVLQPEQMAYFRSYIDSLEKHLYADDWLNKREYADYMDLESFVDWWFVHELAENGEPGWPKSSYMYKDRLGKLTAGPVWDFDYATFIPDRFSYFIINALYYNRLFQDPEFVGLVKERWKLLKPAFMLVPDKIRSEAMSLRYSEMFNHELWPIYSRVNGDELMSYREAVDRIILAYQRKLDWLDKQISEGF